MSRYELLVQDQTGSCSNNMMSSSKVSKPMGSLLNQSFRSTVISQRVKSPSRPPINMIKNHIALTPPKSNVSQVGVIASFGRKIMEK